MILHFSAFQYKINGEKMINISRKLILAATVASLTFLGSVSYADQEKSKGDDGWKSRGDNQKSIVISIQTDPVYDDPEPACVALQIGMNLMMDTVPDSEGNPTHVRPAKKVILFTTIGGVELINPDQDLSANVCLTPGGMNSLENLLQGFVNMEGEVVVCPLCAMTRDITQPTHGYLGSGVDIHNLFLYADKVIDF
jgi:hypothetical protein